MGVIKDGKKIEINIGGVSKSTLATLLEEQQKNILDAIYKVTRGEIAIAENQSSNNLEETQIKSNSLDKIADVMTTNRDTNISNFDKKTDNIKITKKDVSKSIDMLKNLE